jgi:signal transduction histidine kinase
VAAFKASARTLDLLGRQQIANVPSAINELFKNAYDAYASKVEADLIRPENLLIIRDNGYGMTLDDFEKKWLVLGTDSKMEGAQASAYRPPEMPLRPVAGEKGIGRLAIGMLGPQALILTKARRADGLHRMIAAFVNWSAFAIPDIDLWDIEVPIEVLDPDCEPTLELTKNLVAKFKASLAKNCLGRRTQGLETLVFEELETFNVDPRFWLESLGGEDFKSDRSGTHFYVRNVASIVWDAIQPDKERAVPELVRHVLGFTDTMSKSPTDSPMETSLVVHSGPGSYEDLIAESQFWEEDDFASADHEAHGHFDEFGHFDGRIRIFDNEAVLHRIANKESRGHKTECGPFEFHFGYVQGDKDDSRLNPIEFVEFTKRLDDLAGIYVYRDGLRVLPYGDQENDWLRIEERRNKGASYYFFSYRRMFGCVNISRAKNPGLRDKAGREGFQQTRAYSQLRALIVNVLTQLAGDFFRDKDAATLYQRGRAENKKRFRAWEKHQTSKTERLRAFRLRLREAEELIAGSSVEESIEAELTRLDAEVRAVLGQEDGNEIARGLLDVESKYSDRLRSLASKLTVARPRGVALSTSLSRAYMSVNDRRERLVAEVIEPAQARLEEVVLSAARSTKTNLDERLRVTTLVSKQAEAALRKAKQDSSLAMGSGQELASRVAALSKEIVARLDQRLRDVVVQANSYEFESASRASIDILLSDCRNQAALATEFFDSGLIAIREVLEGLVLEWDDETGLLSSLDISESIDSELEELTEVANQDLELAQIGLSVDIVNHEFLSSVNAVRKGLRSLESWAAHNADLRPVYGILQTNFTHLENFMQVFTPLRKRFNAEKTEITGVLIRDYLRSVFFERFRETGVEVEFSDRFVSRRVLSYASVILPAFVNLVDNALFWLSDRPEPRRLVLDLDGTDWLVTDNGPGIPESYREAVFGAGYTSKPGGRGLGLYIAREVLRKNGYDLVIDPTSALGIGSTFRIRKKSSEGT